jgi:hypothetical protein
VASLVAVHPGIILCGVFADSSVMHMCSLYNYYGQCNVILQRASSMCVCVDGNYPELLGAAPQASRAPRRRGGARTTCMVVRPGHTYLHNTFNTY